MKEIVKDLEQAIFGDDDNDDNNDDEELKKVKELDRRFKNLISKKRRELLREYLKESGDANPQDRVNALRKKLNNLPKTSDETSDEARDETSDETSDINDNDNRYNNNDLSNQIKRQGKILLSN